MSTKDATVVDEQAAEAPAWARGLLERLDRLEGDLRETRQRTATFRPMELPRQGHKGQSGIFAGMNPAPGRPVEREGISDQILVDERGDKLPAMLLQQYPPPFAPGDRCRLNPDAARAGWPEGKTWGTVLADLRIDGVGVIRKVYWLKDDGRWKVSAVIRGLTNQRPDGFLDDELLPA